MQAAAPSHLQIPRRVSGDQIVVGNSHSLGIVRTKMKKGPPGSMPEALLFSCSLMVAGDRNAPNTPLPPVSTWGS
jgi:hypothetical protein